MDLTMAEDACNRGKAGRAPTSACLVRCGGMQPSPIVLNESDLTGQCLSRE